MAEAVFCKDVNPELSMSFTDTDTLACSCARLAGHEGDHAGYFFSTSEPVHWPNVSAHELDGQGFV